MIAGYYEHNIVNMTSGRNLFFLNQTLFFLHKNNACIAVSNITLNSFCFRLPEVLRIFDYQSDVLMSNLLTELERFKQEGENYWLSKVQYLFCIINK